MSGNEKAIPPDDLGTSATEEPDDASTSSASAFATSEPVVLKSTSTSSASATSESEVLTPKPTITLIIIAHGEDIPKEPFEDPYVRMLSLAGRSGSIGLCDPNTLKFITEYIWNLYLKYNASMEKYYAKKKASNINKTAATSELYSMFPEANKSKAIPNFNIDEEGNLLGPMSTYTFLRDIFLRDPSTRQETYGKEKIVSLDETGNQILASVFTVEDFKEGLTHRFHNPVINKRYIFCPVSDNPGQASVLNFGFHIVDINNIKTTVAKIKSGLNTLKSSKDDIITLKDICDYLHGVGFEIINIIDVACRECLVEDLRPTDIVGDAVSSVRKSRIATTGIEDAKTDDYAGQNRPYGGFIKSNRRKNTRRKNTRRKNTRRKNTGRKNTRRKNTRRKK